MKRLFFFLTFTLFQLNTLSAQVTFEKTLGDNGISNCIGAIQTSDGNYAIAGYKYVNGKDGVDLCIAKIDGEGNVLWNKTYCDSAASYPNVSFLQTMDNGFILMCCEFIADTINTEIIKTDANGDTLWTRTFNMLNYSSPSYLEVSNIHQTKDGGFILVGTAYVNLVGVGPILVKLDPNGNPAWSEVYECSDDSDFIDGANDVAEARGGGFMVTASGSTGHYQDNLCILKVNALGIAQRFEGFSINNAYYGCILSTDSNNFILTTNADEYGRGTILIKLDSIGKTLFAKSYPSNLGPLTDLYLTKSPENGYILSGYLNNEWQQTTYAHFIKTDKNGDTIFTRAFGPLYGICQLNSICETNDKGYLGGGSISYSTLDSISRMLIMLTDSNGQTNCNDQSIPLNVQPFEITGEFLPSRTLSVSVNISYRPININAGGAFTDICSSAGIEQLNENISIRVYPNPTSDILNIDFPKTITPVKLEVFDITGRIILTETFNQSVSNYRLNLSGYPSGYYILKLETPSKIFSRGFVLNKN